MIAMSKAEERASWREFMLYWVGFLILVIAGISVLLTISGLLIDVLSYRCWIPILSPLMGMSEPPNLPQQVGTLPPYYCEDPSIAIIRFVFNLLSELLVIGAGTYMMLNGKKR
jgi:uncharacterized protein YggT (Ycf19 family)